jgi:GrpB-like predicted nucleotidyltransferase (UPF0157 family)
MNVQVVDYDANWKTLFDQEAQKIKDILGEELINIYHIGSTSVPGLKAKPIIDMMPVVRDIARVERDYLRFEAMGYECLGEFGITGRRYFRKGGSNRTHHVHIFEFGNPNVQRHLAFRDYLRTHPEDAMSYGALKNDLARRFPDDINAYMDGKDPLIKSIEQKALSWFEQQNG